MQQLIRKLISPELIELLESAALAGMSVTTFPVVDPIISRRGKRFGPQDVGLRAGERIIVINGDDIFVRQAYTRRETFALDSDDIESESGAVITFPTEVISPSCAAFT